MDNKKDVRSVVVIGAGIMGRGIAHVSALAGFTTILNDISDDLLEKARGHIQRELEKGVEIGKLTETEGTVTLSRLHLQADLDRAVSNADLIIEAVPEQIEFKLDLFARLDCKCSAEVIFASNTSALSITEMAG